MVFRKYLLIALLTALTLSAAAKWLESRSWISPTAQNASRFIRSYDPTPVVRSFRSACSPWGGRVDMFTQVATGRSDSAGYVPLFGSRRDVEHHLTVEPQYCGNPDTNAALLTALHEDVLAALRNAACWVSDDRLTRKRPANRLPLRYANERYRGCGPAAGEEFGCPSPPGSVGECG
jgi:hypothetical protein